MCVIKNYLVIKVQPIKKYRQTYLQHKWEIRSFNVE